MADYTEQTASAINEAENTGHNTGESSKTILYPVDRLVTDTAAAGAVDCTDDNLGENSDHANLVLRCQFCKRHVQCIDDKITTLQIFGELSHPDNQKHSIQALNCSRCNHKTIGVKLCQRWWQLDEALKSATARTNGFHQVTTLGERILLFLLNSVIYIQQDFEDGRDIPFSPHPPFEQAKLLWHNNAAIGFYTYQNQGAPLNNHVGLLCSWSIPVLDSLYVRKEFRGREHGLQALHNFLTMYPDGPIGVAEPCSKTCTTVCHKYLKKHPEDRCRLWLCTPPGNHTNRVSLWRHSRKVIKQLERNSTTASTHIASLTSSKATSIPTTSLLETLATVSESRRLAEDAEASASHMDSHICEVSKNEILAGEPDESVQSGRREDVGDTVIVSSASSCFNSCHEEHHSDMRCTGCVKSDSQTCGKNGCSNEQSENNLSFAMKDDLGHADSSEAIANISVQGGCEEAPYKETEEEQMDTEPQNIASSSSVLYEAEDFQLLSHEAETTAIDLSSKRPNHVNKHTSNISTDNAKSDAGKRGVDSSIICADDDRSVGGGVLNRADVENSLEEQPSEGNCELLKNLLCKSKVISKQDNGQEPVHTSGSLVKIEVKPDIGDTMYSTHVCQGSEANSLVASDSLETKPIIQVKPEHVQETDEQAALEGVNKMESVVLKESIRAQVLDDHMGSSTVYNHESVEETNSVSYTDGHIRQLLQKEDGNCVSPSQPVRPSRPHPTQVIHNPLSGEERETGESQSKDVQGVLSYLLTNFPQQEDSATATIASSDSDSQQSGENVQLLDNNGQNAVSADSVTGRRRPFRVRDYSSWFTSENYNSMSRQHSPKRSEPHSDATQESGAIPRSWKRSRRSDVSSDRLRPPSWSIWPQAQSGERLREALTGNQVSATDTSSSGVRAAVTVRELLQRHTDVPEPSSTLPSVINTSSYTPTSTTYVYSNSMSQQPPPPQQHIPSQRFLSPPVTSYNTYVAQQEKQTGEPVGHFHTFRWTRPRRVYARRGARQPSASARSSTPDSSFDDIRPVAPLMGVTDDQSTRAEALAQHTQDTFASTRSRFSQSSLHSQEVAGSSMTVTESTQSRDVNALKTASPSASTSSDGDVRNLTSSESNSSLIKQLLLRESGIHAPKAETVHRQSCAHESRVSQSQSTEEDPRIIIREEGEISSHQRGDQDEEEEEEEEIDNKAALRLQLGINVGVSVGAMVNFRNTQTSSYTCEHCDIVFTDSVMYVLHMGCHGRRSAFECNRCGVVCRDKYEFAIHFIQGEHNID